MFSLTGGEVPKPIVIVDPNSSAGQATHTGDLQAAFMRLLGGVEAARLTAQAYEGQGGTADQEFLTGTLARAIQAWDNPPLTVTLSESGALATEDEEAPAATNDFAHSSAGIMVQFAMAGLMGAAAIIVAERKTGTMLRLLTTPVTRLEIVLGHFLAMFIMILAQLSVLIRFGQLLLGVGYLREPLATLLMLLTTAFWAASLGLLIGVFARTEEQVMIFALIVMLLLSGLGGAWMPLEFTDKTFQTVGHFLPTAWAIDGFENIVVRGLGSICLSSQPPSCSASPSSFSRRPSGDSVSSSHHLTRTPFAPILYSSKPSGLIRAGFTRTQLQSTDKEVKMRATFRWTRVVLALLCAFSLMIGSAGAKYPDYQTGFDEWLAAERDFATWQMSGAGLSENGELVLDPTTAMWETDPYAAGTYYGGNFYTGGTYWVGEATGPNIPPDFDFDELIASWNAETPAGAWVEVLVRAKLDARWTKWYNLGVWARPGDNPAPLGSAAGRR